MQIYWNHLHSHKAIKPCKKGLCRIVTTKLIKLDRLYTQTHFIRLSVFCLDRKKFFPETFVFSYLFPANFTLRFP